MSLGKVLSCVPNISLLVGLGSILYSVVFKAQGTGLATDCFSACFSLKIRRGVWGETLQRISHPQHIFAFMFKGTNTRPILKEKTDCKQSNLVPFFLNGSHRHLYSPQLPLEVPDKSAQDVYNKTRAV